MILIENDVIKILETVFKQKRGTITSETPLESFVKDSMDIIEFIAILKNKHHITIKPTEIAKLKSVDETVSYVIKHQSYND